MKAKSSIHPPSTCRYRLPPAEQKGPAPTKRTHSTWSIAVLVSRSPRRLCSCREHYPRLHHSTLVHSPCLCWFPSTTGTPTREQTPCQPFSVSQMERPSCSQMSLAYSTLLAVEVVRASVYVAVHPGDHCNRHQTQNPKVMPARHGTTPSAVGASITATSRPRATPMAMVVP